MKISKIVLVGLLSTSVYAGSVQEVRIDMLRTSVKSLTSQAVKIMRNNPSDAELAVAGGLLDTVSAKVGMLDHEVEVLEDEVVQTIVHDQNLFNVKRAEYQVEYKKHIDHTFSAEEMAALTTERDQLRAMRKTMRSKHTAMSNTVFDVMDGVDDTRVLVNAAIEKFNELIS